MAGHQKTQVQILVHAVNQFLCGGRPRYVHELLIVCTLLKIKALKVEGVGIFRAIENTELIDFARRSKRLILENCAQLERI
jgi:hypothetical protein